MMNARLRQLLRRIDPGFFIVLLICLIALWPFIGRASLPQETDAELHIFRLAELSTLIRQGEFYPRWAPDFYHGYGYPIFNYYAPLSYYVGLVVELLPRLDAVAGVKFVFVLGLLLAALGTYGFVRDHWGRQAGYVAAAVYLYAPYVQYIDPHARGVLAESFSLGIFPIALWANDRFRRQPTGWRLLTAVFTTAAVILSHNLMAMLFFGFLLAWAVWEWGLDRWQHTQTGINAQTASFRLLVASLLLGLCLAAFFWLPVGLERHAVNLNTLLGQGDNYDFRTHFLSLQDMLATTLRLDWGASEPAFRFNLGTMQWILGGLGAVLLLSKRTRDRGRLVFFAAATLILLFLMLPASTFVWQAVPVLPFFQFPWRLLGAVAFTLAVLAGAGIQALSEMGGRWVTVIAPLIGIAAPLLFALPLSQPAPWPDFGPVTLVRLNQIEHRGRWLGTTSTADYVPSTVDIIPAPNPTVVQGFAAGQPLDRVNRVTLPPDVVVEAEYVRPLLTRYHVIAPAEFRLRLFQFDFPGWQVRIDGKRVQTELGRPEGFLVIPVPQGDHLVEVKFGSTPARTFSWLLSGLALLVALVWAWRLGNTAAQLALDGFVLPDWLAMGVVGGITAVFLVVLQPAGVLHYNSTGYHVVLAQEDMFADLGEQVALIGYTSSTTELAPGDTLHLSLYWHAQTKLDINYQVFVHVLAAGGSLVAQSDKLNPGDFPTRRWTLDKYVRDDHTLTLPANLLPGRYTVAAGLWVAAEGWRLPLLDEAGSQIGDYAPLFEFVIGEP